ncbi:hypothetical protein C8Q73DRAFT_364212 [Cubamyces lactineus]|nr:hypothetical protein C8Q73DRAFT_364212 [Cubamyces lactineus]
MPVVSPRCVGRRCPATQRSASSPHRPLVRSLPTFSRPPCSPDLPLRTPAFRRPLSATSVRTLPFLSLSGLGPVGVTLTQQHVLSHLHPLLPSATIVFCPLRSHLSALSPPSLDRCLRSIPLLLLSADLPLLPSLYRLSFRLALPATSARHSPLHWPLCSPLRTRGLSHVLSPRSLPASYHPPLTPPSSLCPLNSRPFPRPPFAHSVIVLLLSSPGGTQYVPPSPDPLPR